MSEDPKPEKFNDSDRAVNYVISGLQRDFPDSTFEIIQVVRNRPRKERCTLTEVGNVLNKACSRFPMASVEYHPENPYGFVAEIRCHGEKKSGHTSFQRHTTDRPRVLVMVTTVGEKPILVGSHKVPRRN